MSMMKIEPNVVDANGDFTFGNVTVAGLQTTTGKVIDGVLEKNYNIPGSLKTNTGTTRWWVPTDISISSVICSTTTAPNGSDVEIAIKKNGTQVDTASVTSNSFSTTTSVSITATTGDYFTVDITQVGSTITGSDLVVTFLYYRT